MRFTALLFLTTLLGSLVNAQDGAFGLTNAMNTLGSFFPEVPPIQMPKFTNPLTEAQNLFKNVPRIQELNPIKDISTGVTNAINTLESMIPKFEGIPIPAKLPTMEITMPKITDPLESAQNPLKNVPGIQGINPIKDVSSGVADAVSKLRSIFPTLDAGVKIPAELPPIQLPPVPESTDSLASAQKLLKNVPEIQEINPIKMIIQQGLLIPKQFMKDTERRMSEGVESGKKFINDGFSFVKLLKSFFN